LARSSSSQIDLFFEEKSALGCLCHRKILGEFVALVDVHIGDVRRTLGVFVVHVNGDDSIFAGDHVGIGLECGAGIGEKILFVDFFEFESRDDVVGERTTFHHADIQVVRVLDAERAAGRACE
jgi:hypothetical protein